MYRAIESAKDLPALGYANEGRALDFKAEPSDDSFEIAKDVAAFANAEGGTILIGARGKGEFLAKYEPLTTGQASDAQRLYEQSVRDRCGPRPMVNVSPIPKDDGIVLAVNVEPFPGQLVGVEVRRGEARCGKGLTQPEGLFYFPMRVGAHTVGIMPEQMPMFIDARMRRIAICLQGAIGKTVVVLRSRAPEDDDSVHVQPMTLEAVDVLGCTFTVRFLDEERRNKEVKIAIPFDLVEAAWRDGERAFVALLGRIKGIDWLPNLGPEYQALAWVLDPRG